MSFMHRMSYISQYRHRLALPLLLGMLVFAALLSGTTQAPHIYAAGSANFTLQPATFDPANPLSRAYFILSGKPGTTLQNGIVVANKGTATGTVNLYPVDASTDQTGGIVYLGQDAARRATGAWIKMSISQVTLAAGQSKVIPFQVIVPANVQSGQHVGGIVAESTQQNTSTKDSKIHVTVLSRRVVAVEVNLPGPQIEQLQATGIQVAGSDNYEILKLGLSNTGTLLFKSAGTLKVYDQQGKLLQNLNLSLGSFLPQTSITYPAYVQKKALGAGTYTASVMITYGHGHLLRYSTTFAITDQRVQQIFHNNAPLSAPGTVGSLPLLPLVAAGIVILAAACLIVFLLTRKFSRV